MLPTTVLVYYFGSIQLLCDEVSAEESFEYAKSLHDAGLKVLGIYDLDARPLFTYNPPEESTVHYTKGSLATLDKFQSHWTSNDLIMNIVHGRC